MAFERTSFDGLRVDGVEYISTGSGALAETIDLDTDVFLEEVRLHFSAAPDGTPAEDFTVSLDSDTSVVYDVNLLTVDTSQDADANVGVVTDIVWRPVRPVKVTKDNAIDFNFTNTDGVTWGLTVVMREGRK